MINFYIKDVMKGRMTKLIFETFLIVRNFKKQRNIIYRYKNNRKVVTRKDQVGKKV